MSVSVVFKKTDKQKEAVKLLISKAKDIMLFGGSRSGKTFILVYAILVRASKVKSRHCILRFKFNHAKRSIWLDTLPKVVTTCFPHLGITEKNYNKSDYFLKLPNGSEIWVGGLDDKERVEKILGNEYSTMYFNESSQINSSSVGIAKTRLAEKNTLAKKAYYDCNPPVKTHWSYWMFIKKLQPEDNEPLANPENYESLLMNPTDNLENIDEDYINLLKSMSEKDQARFLRGEFSDADDGIAYYSFRRDDHTAPVQRLNGEILIGMDFNVDPMTAVFGQIRDDKLYIFSEAFLRNSDTYKMRDYILRNNLQGRIIPDSTGRNRKTSGQSDFLILQGSGMRVEKTYNPFVSDRVNNVNRLLQDGRIIIDPSCKKLINDLEKVSWKDNKLDQKTDPLLTHISDCLGYLAWWYEPLVKIPETKITSWA